MTNPERPSRLRVALTRHYDGKFHLRAVIRTLIPRTKWAVVERDGQPELVIWRMWLGNSYDIVSLAGGWGRWDRQRIAREATE